MYFHKQSSLSYKILFNLLKITFNIAILSNETQLKNHLLIEYFRSVPLTALKKSLNAKMKFELLISKE